MTAAEDVWRVAVVRSAAGFQFCCGSCDRVSDPTDNPDVTVALMVGHLFADHLPSPVGWPTLAEQFRPTEATEGE